ncbi:MAG: tRNA (adenosine(37)-N6)-dimethylallyltransferase MiaA [Candidatus Zambryskibacteria bacterium]|nr:tRNA (adenosine(37)-N6)-dimethylallyltransferase MiaA [Candidatus Zambryskibacteria bacterium]
MIGTKVVAIVGPTASGKSALAVKLAKKFGGEIISADSRQVYKGLDVGTGKITRHEMHGVPHHLLDVANPKQQFSVSDFLILTNQAIAEIVKKNKMPIVVGGTGFYIDALTGTVVFPNVPPNQKFRDKLGKKSADELFKILKKKDSRRAKTIDAKNRVRLMRALEIVDKIGPVPQLGGSTSKYNFIFVGLKPNNINQRIYKRLIKRLPAMIREGRKLHRQNLTYKRMHELGLEYRYIAMYLQGKITKQEMLEKLSTAIRQYAKRQMTWFKRNKKIRWFRPIEYRKIEKYLTKTLGGR